MRDNPTKSDRIAGDYESLSYKVTDRQKGMISTEVHAERFFNK